jgi:single-stranded DNA-specific DHH superfamily exonuclease
MCCWGRYGTRERRINMAKRVNESARVLNFFKQADLGKAEVLYDLVRETMEQRLAPGKAAKKAVRKKKEASKVYSSDDPPVMVP